MIGATINGSGSLDKTGTLTVGKPAFRGVVASAGAREDEVLRLAASLDQASEHPLTNAIVALLSVHHSRCDPNRRLRFQAATALPQ